MRVQWIRSCVLVLTSAATLALVPVAPAAAQSALPDKYEFIVGGFNATFNTVFGLKVTTPNDITLVDFERDLDSPDRDNVFRGSAAIRFGRHQFRAGYYETPREGSTQIDTQIIWGDQVFNIGATLGVTYFGVKMGVNAALNARSTEAQVDTHAVVPLGF